MDLRVRYIKLSSKLMYTSNSFDEEIFAEVNEMMMLLEQDIQQEKHNREVDEEYTARLESEF